MKNKRLLFLIKISAATVAVFIMMVIHDCGRYLYTQNYKSVSHGVTLGFVAFYILYVMTPSLFIMSITTKWLFLVIYLAVSILLFFLWYAGNPLRVSLMLLSYTVASMCLFFMTCYLDKKTIKVVKHK